MTENPFAGELMELDFHRGYRASQLMDDDGALFRASGGSSGHDRDYLWEGDELMFEDIVASTQPLHYNPAFLRKFDYEGAFHHSFHDDEDDHRGDEPLPTAPVAVVDDDRTDAERVPCHNGHRPATAGGQEQPVACQFRAISKPQ